MTKLIHVRSSVDLDVISRWSSLVMDVLCNKTCRKPLQRRCLVWEYLHHRSILTSSSAGLRWISLQPAHLHRSILKAVLRKLILVRISMEILTTASLSICHAATLVCRRRLGEHYQLLHRQQKREMSVINKDDTKRASLAGM
ncbi:hypothetical protein RRG08_039713 [Elysia crispata]|uniref:Uncharacterized protein n=1 Tax=Elysia crispata TaxID=231223 RepID=A0AAE0YBN3_9GAST|nr:hypothetical protein RRG08_039713 [Elysia crispata]